MTWIHVTDSLPEDGLSVLVGVEDTWCSLVTFAYLDKGIWIGPKFGNVTWWMKVPKPPMKKDEE